MKIAIVGTGAMGSIYAALLADAGNEVWAVDTWEEHVAAIRGRGLRVEGASGDRTVTGINAVTSVADVGACDLYVIATKASGVGPAAAAVSVAARPDSLVLTIQNGLGADERIAKFMPTGNVLLGVADGFGASIVGPGHAIHTAMKLIRLGEMRGGMTDRLGTVETVWRDAGFTVESFEDINRLIWEKFLCNVTLSAPCTYYGCTVAELRAEPAWWRVALNCMREAHAIGVVRGIAFSFEDPETYVTRFAKGVGDARPSMLQDHLAKRPSELDAINGRVPLMGAEHGIPTPENERLCAELRARERTFNA